MATLELDPLFSKGLKLLHSKAKDSTEQLRQLLDDVLVQRQTISTTKDRNLFGAIKQEDSNSRLSSLSKKSSPNYGSDNGNSSSRLFLTDEVKKEDKRKLDKTKQEPIEFPLEIKRPKMESPQHSLSSTPSPQPIKTELITPKAEDESDSSDVNADADEFAMEMGLACVVCKQIEVVQGNNLVECQECHSLYHQECHRPPVINHDINDPRHVWYCSRCTKNMKKMATKTHKSTKTSTNVSTKEPTPVFRSVKTEAPSSTLLPFKRAEPRVPSSQSSGLSSANKPFGLAGLAANLSGKTTASTSSVTSKSGSSVKSGNSGSTSVTTTKPFSSPFSFLPSTRTTSSVTQAKATNVSGLSSLATIASTMSKAGSSTSTSHSKIGLGTLSSTIAPSSGKSTSGGNNGGVKSASSSYLMSADKRLQIMKKRAAAKMQEKRRLSTK